MSRTPSITSVASAGSASSSALLPTAAAIPLAPNKGAGTCGRPIKLDVNYLALNLNKLVPFVYHYDVTIEPNMPKRYMPKVFEQFRRTNFPKVFIAFDGQKSAFAPQLLKLEAITERKIMYQADGEVRSRAYMVNMKAVKESSKIDTKSLLTYQNSRQFDGPARALQAVEIVLKSVFLHVKGVGCGRAFYRPLLDNNNRRSDLGDFYDMWTGLFQSTVLGQIPYLNVDIAHKAFPRPMAILDILRDMRADPARGLQQYEVQNLKDHLKGLRIVFQRPNAPESTKSYKFGDLGDSASQYKFKDDEVGQLVTVQAYFLRKHKMALKFPQLPCVRTHPLDKNIYLPLEMCSVADNQAVMKKCTENQTRAMIKQAATSTDVRRGKIMALLKEIKHNDSPTLQQFGIGVDGNFASINARVLNPPTLEYANKKQVKPVRGVWNPAGEFLFPMQLPNWSILILEERTNERAVHEFIAQVCSIAGKPLFYDTSPVY